MAATSSTQGTLCGALVALAGALGARAAHLPLPWLLGPLLAVAALHLTGRSAPAPEALRSAGQIVVGAAVGVAFVPTVAAVALALWPLVLANAVATTLCGIAGAWLLHRGTRVDLRTCFLSAAIGGASDMQALAERYGADADIVATAHVLRLSLVVLVVPIALACIVGDGTPATSTAAANASSPSGVVALLAIAGAAGWAARRLRVPNAWGIAPLVASCACAAGGLQLGDVPATLVHAGQLAIGWSLGSRFSAGFFRARPRFLVAVAVYTFGVLITSVALGCAIGQWAVDDTWSVVLGAAPGGVAEMSITAKLLSLDVPLVTSLQLTRIVAAALLTAPLLVLVQRSLAAKVAHRDRPAN
jgi:membrane AbrB-like protein